MKRILFAFLILLGGCARSNTDQLEPTPIIIGHPVTLLVQYNGTNGDCSCDKQITIVNGECFCN